MNHFTEMEFEVRSSFYLLTVGFVDFLPSSGLE